MSLEGVPPAYRRMFSDEKYIEVLGRTWDNKREFPQLPDKPGDPKTKAVYLYDGNPDAEPGSGEWCEVLAVLMLNKYVLYGRTDDEMNARQDRLDATYAYGLQRDQELSRAKVPTLLPVQPATKEVPVAA